MKKTFTIKALLITCIGMLMGISSFAQPQGEYIATVGTGDDDTKKVVLFDPDDGSLVYGDFISLETLDVGTVKHVIRVNDELWISDQTKDKIWRFNNEGILLGTIGESGGLDNLRGMNIINGEVWLSNAGTNNGAPGKAVVQINFDGEITGSFPTEGSPWSYLPYGNDEVLISFSNNGSFSSQIGLYDYNGTFLSSWNTPAEINFIQQISQMANGHILASAFSNATGGYPSGVHEYDSEGNYISAVGGTSGNGPRGNIELGNGNIMWTNGQGVHIANTVTGTSTLIYEGSLQFLEKISFSPPPMLDPPTDLSATVDGDDVSLNWVAPATKELLGYNIYRDDIMINTSTVSETMYLDQDVEAGNHLYAVSAVYDNGESPKTNPVMIFIEGALGKIQGFVRDAVSNLSISDAWIVASNTENGALTTSTPFGGHYVLNLPAGTYSLTCGADGYSEQSMSNVIIETGMVKSYTFYLEATESEILTGIWNESGNSLSIYPNPGSEQITISGLKLNTVQIIDYTGQVVFDSKANSDILTIDIREFPSGIYFVKGDLEGQVIVKKLIVK